MGNVTESIFSGESVIIPMAEVQFIEKDLRKGFSRCITVVLSGSTWNASGDHWNNAAYLSNEEAEKFRAAWCRYRFELECETLVD